MLVPNRGESKAICIRYRRLLQNISFFYVWCIILLKNLIIEVDQTCSITSFLANGIPDYPVNSGFNSRTTNRYTNRWIFNSYGITGSTKTSIAQHDRNHGGSYLLGYYSHTTDAVSYYTNGHRRHCGKARRAQLTWNCGDRHMELVGASEPVKCEYHFEIEVKCCQHNDRLQGKH